MDRRHAAATLRRDGAALRSVAVGTVRVLDVSYRPLLRVGRHEHEHGYLCLVASGSFDESWRTSNRRGVPGSFYYYPDQVMHRGRYHERGARVLHLEIAAGDVAALCPGAGDAAVPFGDLRATRAAALTWQLLRELDGGATGDELAVESLVAEILAETFGVPPRRRRPAPSWLDRVEEILRDRHGASSGLTAIAAEVGRHPSHVARDYRRHTGSTLGQRARRLRVARAAQAIADGGLSLAQVAQEAGFADQSHMGRAFKALMGTTPAAFRRAVRAPSHR
jgi:AraC family transcriptional regulator